MYKHNFDKTILRSYDIRGIYEKTLSDKDAFMLGYFFGVTVKKNLPRKKSHGSYIRWWLKCYERYSLHW